LIFYSKLWYFSALMYIRSLTMIIKYRTVAHEWIGDLVATFLLTPYPLAHGIDKVYPVNVRNTIGFVCENWVASIPRFRVTRYRYTKTVGRGWTNMSHWTIFPFNPRIKSFFPFYSFFGMPTQINITCTLHSLHKSILGI